MNLDNYTTTQLLEEIGRRSKNDITDWCDDCVWFGKAKCKQGHKIDFHTPCDMGEAVDQYWGYYNLCCEDRKAR